MKLFISSMFFLLSFCATLWATQYADVKLFPIPIDTPTEFWIEWGLQGHTESEIQSGIQRKYFFLSPELIQVDDAHSNVRYVGRWLGKRNILIVESKDTNYALAIGYQFIGGSRVERFKNTYYQKRLIDQVNYFYEDSSIVATWSGLYGIQYFRARTHRWQQWLDYFHWLWIRLNTY